MSHSNRRFRSVMQYCVVVQEHKTLRFVETAVCYAIAAWGVSVDLSFLLTAIQKL